MKFMRSSVLLTTAGILIVFGVVMAYGQSNLASVSGVVTDPQGAMVPGASVAATSMTTGIETKTVTDSAGFYAIRELPIGTYTVTIEHPGFRRYVRQGIILTTGQSLGLDVGLELGTVSQALKVTAAEPLIEMRTSDVSNMVTSQAVEALPLANRRTLNLVELSGAAVFVRYNSIIGNANPDFSLAGGRTQSQMAWLDGANIQNMRLGVGQINLDPPVDAVQEVKVMQNNYSAEYGGSAGGVIVETTKSGTNQLHGSAYEFFRNDTLDAAGFFAPVQNGTKIKPELRYNLFGGTIGGPIRHDKTFFFFSYEGGRLRQGGTDTLTVPTALQRAGNFSQTFNSNGQLVPIYDPATTRQVNGTFVRDQFPGNILTGQLDPVAVKLMNFYPMPNRPPSNLAGANNFSGNFVAGTSGNIYLVKVDHNFRTGDRLSGWYISNETSPHNTSVFPDPAADPRNFSINRLHYGYGSWFHMYSPNKMNDLSVTYTHRLFHNMSFGLGGTYPSKLGLRGVPEDAFPQFAPAGFSPLGSTQQERRQFPIGSESVLDNFSWVRGRHALKFGFQETRSSNHDVLLSAVSGSFSFSTLPTGLPGNSNTGSGLASLLLGFPTSFNELATEKLDRSAWYLAGFAKDDWTVHSSLTLNFGLRWERDTPIRDAHNRINSFDPTEINPVSGTPGVVKFAGINGFPTSVYSGDWDNFAPRFGFAWRPFHSSKTVVRGGYGVFYAHPFDAAVPFAAALGFSLSANLASPDNGITAPFYLRGGVPISATAPTLNDAFGAVPASENPKTAVTFFERQRKAGMSQQFNLGVEHELGGGFVLQVTALGNISRNLPGDTMSLNQIPPSILGPHHDSQKDRPFPQFTDVSALNPPLAVSNYYAGMVRLEKRFSGAFSLGASYTYSSFLASCDHNPGATLGENGGCYSNFYDRAADYGPAGNDIRHHLVFNWVYELPFGSGRRWLGSSPARYLAGGWTLANVSTIQSGPPFTVTALTNTTNAFSVGALRPNVLRNPNLPSSQRSVGPWFDTGAFQQPTQFQFGNEGVGTLRAARLVDFDFSLLRKVRLNERTRLEFRGEFLNAFNHTNWGVPGRVYGASNFGVISSAGPARVVQLAARIVF